MKIDERKLAPAREFRVETASLARRGGAVEAGLRP